MIHNTYCFALQELAKFRSCVDLLRVLDKLLQ